MKIGFVLDDSLDSSDGVQQYVLTLGAWLSQNGHKVHYLVGQTQRQDVANVHSLSRNLPVRFNHNRMSTPLPASKRLIRRLLAKHDFDILHVQMPYSPWLAGRVVAAAPPRTAVVGTFHVIAATRFEAAAAYILGKTLRRNLRRFDRILSVSEPAARHAKRVFGVDSFVLPNVIRLASFRAVKPLPGLDSTKFTIVFLGRLVERKGCLQLLQALAYLHKKNRLNDIQVFICGRGPLDRRLKEFVARNKLDIKVRFAGYVSETEKAAYLAGAQIAVMPSVGGESFGIVLLEAMAAGAEVVLAGDNVGYRSVLINREDQLVKPHDTIDFANRLERFISDANARERARAWQQNYVKQFDVGSIGSKLLNHYEQVIAKRRKSSDNKLKS